MSRQSPTKSSKGLLHNDSVMEEADVDNEELDSNQPSMKENMQQWN